jgi:hypothetical protein
VVIHNSITNKNELRRCSLNANSNVAYNRHVRRSFFLPSAEKIDETGLSNENLSESPSQNIFVENNYSNFSFDHSASNLTPTKLANLRSHANQMSLNDAELQQLSEKRRAANVRSFSLASSTSSQSEALKLLNKINNKTHQSAYRYGYQNKPYEYKSLIN